LGSHKETPDLLGHKEKGLISVLSGRHCKGWIQGTGEGMGMGMHKKVRVRNVRGQKKAIYRDELCGHNTAVDLLQGRRSID
jgi:hypothetical protein